MILKTNKYSDIFIKIIKSEMREILEKTLFISLWRNKIRRDLTYAHILIVKQFNNIFEIIRKCVYIRIFKYKKLVELKKF